MFESSELQFWSEVFFEQYAIQNNCVLCYWPTIHSLISKICPKLNFSVLTFLMSRRCSMSSGQNLYKEMQGSTPIHVQCDNMYWPKVWSHCFWYILCGLIWTWAVWEWQYPKNCQWGFRLQNMTSLIHRLGRSFQQLFKWLIKQLF